MKTDGFTTTIITMTAIIFLPENIFFFSIRIFSDTGNKRKKKRERKRGRGGMGGRKVNCKHVCKQINNSRMDFYFPLVKKKTSKNNNPVTNFSPRPLRSDISMMIIIMMMLMTSPLQKKIFLIK